MAQDLINKTKVTLQTTVTEGAPEQRAAAVVSDPIVSIQMMSRKYADTS